MTKIDKIELDIDLYRKTSINRLALSEYIKTYYFLVKNAIQNLWLLIQNEPFS